MNTQKTCPECLEKLRELQQSCQGCGYTIELVPEEEAMQRYLNRPSLGGLLWTQAYALGTRQYLWFVLSLIPLVHLVAMGAMAFYGRRWSWNVGGWATFAQFKRRQRIMDVLAVIWTVFWLTVLVLLAVLLWRGEAL